MNKPKFFMLVGLPASGKSTFAETISKDENATIHSSDKIREELSGDVNSQENNDKVFALLHKRVKEDLNNGINTIYDATNINYKRRMAFLNEIKGIECETICILMATPYEDCIANNASRERSIPEHVITRMYKNIYIPQYYEGWDNIGVAWNYDTEKYILDELFVGRKKDGLCFIPQDNPNHTLTIGEHCSVTAINLNKIYPEASMELFLAATLHDIGKKFTKSFVNKKGETTDIAHYYQHHLVSAYDSMFYENGFGRGVTQNVDPILRAGYITWHMQPYFWENKKQEEKYKQIWGEDFYNGIMWLHEADKMAK